MKLLIVIFTLSSLAINSNAFVPASLISSTILKVDRIFFGAFGQVSESLTHEEILKRGIIQSAVQFFYDQPNGQTTVKLSKKSSDYYDLSKLYFDFYNVSECYPDLSTLLITTFSPNIARVDLSSTTKDLPYAHFDAETFLKSNELVINVTNRIYEALNVNDYSTARELSGQVLHTIQDYYSHSNHVEMGKLTQLNELIGTVEFNNQAFVSPTEINACNGNCNLISVPCSTLAKILSSLLSFAGYQSTITSCPLQYFNCTNNIGILDKLLSGYYTGQALTDGTPVIKPDGLVKCSHGGVLDPSSLIPALGGINKDSGFLLFSPHADLHLKAAALAINHTEFFFNKIRKNIGDTRFDKFLKLTLNSETLSKKKTGVYTCSSTSITISIATIVFSNILCFLYRKL